ncbi:hypothetical protein [Mesorhizobium australicum]|uniref:hypothetical protein n=1 Tax=Mesorhizobium australicum TaxID=536018 RepID=UPI00333BAF3B
MNTYWTKVIDRENVVLEEFVVLDVAGAAPESMNFVPFERAIRLDLSKQDPDVRFGNWSKADGHYQCAVTYLGSECLLTLKAVRAVNTVDRRGHMSWGAGDVEFN